MLKRIFPLCLFALSAWAQQTNSVIQPDVSFSFGPMTTTGVVQLPNSTESIGVRYWNVDYKITGFSVVSITLQGAPDNFGAPGSWVTMPGSVYLGANPLTSISGGFMGLDINPANNLPWVRINVGTATGTGVITGRVYGYRNFPGCPSPCPISGTGDNGTPTPATFGTLSSPVSLTTSGLTQLIPLSGTSSIRLTHISVSFAASTDFQLEYGTGSNCGTGTTALTGVYKTVLTLALGWDLDPLIIPAGKALCANLGSSVTGGGLVKYAQF